MEKSEFDELAGRIEGVARAVLALAWTMELETCMDGPSLSARWRESVGPQTDGKHLHNARKTLHELAQCLDDVRTKHQESVAAARLADPSLLDRPPPGRGQ